MDTDQELQRGTGSDSNSSLSEPQLSTLTTGIRELLIEGHASQVSCISWNPRENILFSGASDNTTRLWNLDSVTDENATVEELSVTTHANKVLSCDWTVDGTGIAIGCANGRVEVLNRNVHNETTSSWQKKLHTDLVRQLKFNPSGTIFATASYDKKVILWESRDGKIMQYFEDHSYIVFDVDWLNEDTLASCAGRTGAIIVWNLHQKRPVKKYIHGHIVNMIKWNRHNGLLASGSNDSSVKIWDLGQSEPIHTLSDHTAQVHCVDWLPNYLNVLASGSADGTVRLWDALEGVPTRVLRRPDVFCVLSISFAPRGTLIGSGDRDGGLCIWDIRTRKLVHKYNVANSSPVGEVAWNRSGDILAACSGAWHNNEAAFLIALDLRNTQYIRDRPEKAASFTERNPPRSYRLTRIASSESSLKSASSQSATGKSPIVKRDRVSKSV